MIVPNKLLVELMDTYEHNALRPFIIIVGPSRSGKSYLTEIFLQKIGADSVGYVLSTMNDVRTFLDLAYSNRGKAYYIVEDADNLSMAALNALLKIAEEPPSDVHIILHYRSKRNILDTIKSRASLYTVSPYDPKDLRDFAQELLKSVKNAELGNVLVVADTPGSIELVVKTGDTPSYVYNFVTKVLENVGTVNSVNFFRIMKSIYFSEEEKKEGQIEANLFLQAMAHVAEHNTQDGSSIRDLTFAVKVASAAEDVMERMTYKGVRKVQLLETFLLRLRLAYLKTFSN